MTANWQAGIRWQYPKGHGDVEPMLAQRTRTGGFSDSEPRKSVEKRGTVSENERLRATEGRQ